MIRHVTAIDNTKNGIVIDPLKTKHAVVTALEISDLSGWIDPVTHLNLDFFPHLVTVVFVAERLEKGAKIVMDGDKFMCASIDPCAYCHYGEVDVVNRSDQLKNAARSLTMNKKR